MNQILLEKKGANNIPNEWEKDNYQLIGKIKEKINHLNKQRKNGTINEEECELSKPTCIYNGKPHRIVGYSYSVGDGAYLKFSLQAYDETTYFSLYAYNLNPRNIETDH